MRKISKLAFVSCLALSLCACNKKKTTNSTTKNNSTTNLVTTSRVTTNKATTNTNQTTKKITTLSNKRASINTAINYLGETDTSCKAIPNKDEYRLGEEATIRVTYGEDSRFVAWLEVDGSGLYTGNYVTAETITFIVPTDFEGTSYWRYEPVFCKKDRLAFIAKYDSEIESVPSYSPIAGMNLGISASVNSDSTFMGWYKGEELVSLEKDITVPITGDSLFEYEAKAAFGKVKGLSLDGSIELKVGESRKICYTVGATNDVLKVVEVSIDSASDQSIGTIDENNYFYGLKAGSTKIKVSTVYNKDLVGYIDVIVTE